MDLEAEARGTKRKADGLAAEPVVEPEPTAVPADGEAGPRRIKALDPNVVNKIAAGEIIIAPVHALKELVENAVDAGATMLEVLVKEGGLKLLQITDNGCGIDRADLAILCERFTTSKLQTFADLGAMTTYGFRGEALASISHIAHLTVTTRTRTDPSAWRACYEAGRLAPPKPGQDAAPKRVAGRPGTQITVEDLFYNVPTRRRAFRSPADEYNKMVDMLGRYAVHCAGVGFSCKKHGEAAASIAVPAAAAPVDRIRHIYGSAVAAALLPLDVADARWGFAARGLATSANHTLKRTTLLLFVNHRCVESTNIRKALDELYAAFLPKGGHPFVYLSLTIDPQRVDVNVHPTKREVNFLNEDDITRAVCDHLAAQLAVVDTTRTFSTQTLLPGQTLATAAASPGGDSPAAPKRTPVRPYENNLVRTDTNLRKITSMFTPATPGPASRSSAASAASAATPSGSTTAAAATAATPRAPPDAARTALTTVEYELVERPVSAHWLQSIRELKEAVVADTNGTLTSIFRHASFVGVVDDRRRLVALQSGVKLYLLDYGRACFVLLYQRGLHDFGNFGVLRFQPPLDLRALLRMADSDSDAAVDAVAAQLVERRQMLLEYFSLEITPTAELRSIPLLVKGYTPPLSKLPQFLLRLGPAVRWNDEKGCFDTFLRELARFYVPEQLPNTDEDQADRADETDETDETLRARRDHVRYAVEHVFLPAFKTQLICTDELLQAGLVEVANLKGLYRVFERC